MPISPSCRIFEEKASGGRWDRPQLQDCLKHLREGDVLIVWKLDRLSRSLSDLLRILDKVKKAGATFKSLTESLDTTGACGQLMMHMMAAFAEFEINNSGANSIGFGSCQGERARRWPEAHPQTRAAGGSHQNDSSG
jgi:DNA invertase Pin-like site-specific DNA recombinase